MATHNVPYTQLNSPTWQRFIDELKPGFKLPSDKVFSVKIKEYAKHLEQKSYSDMRGQEAGICIDGAGFNIKKYYAVVLINGTRARLAKIYHVSDQTADKLSSVVADVFTKATQHGITITGTCSDNARNLIAALEGSDEKSLIAKIGSYLLRVSCYAHTSQLSIIDIRRIDERIDKILNDCIQLSFYIDRRDKTFHEFLDAKCPDFIATRWNSACNVLEFMIENCDKINQFLGACIAAEDNEYQELIEKNQRRIDKGKPPTEVSPPAYPPIEFIPITWPQLLESLKIVRSFTTRIEGDISLQQQVFIEARNVSTSLTALEVAGNPFAGILRDAFEHRFMTTADILISELAWRFTPEGVIEWRGTFAIDMISVDREANERAHKHYNELCERFVSLCESVFAITTDEQKAFYAFPALFEWWLSEANVNSGESTRSLWRAMKYKSIQIPGFQNGRAIPLNNLWRIAIALTTLPASESICERCFSQIKHLANDLNHRMASDMFESLATVKMATYFMNKY